MGGPCGLLSGIGGIKLKKIVTKEKTMFSSSEGNVGQGAGSATATSLSDGRKALSKLVDFPGDVEEIKKHLEDEGGVDPNGPDAYGLCAIHKFASWNKTVLLEMLIPKLPEWGLETKDKDGKTALHWAVEMASVASVKKLVGSGCDVEAKDGKGRTVGFILDNAGDSGVIERLKKAVTGE
jgi:ankyrin repeat protein